MRRELDIPDEVLELFVSPDPQKDRERFWAELRRHFQDRDGNWDARWAEFVFPGESDFTGASFPDYADLDAVTFLGEATFNAAVFWRGVSFDGVQFRAAANFYAEVRFEGRADFSGADFRDRASFFSARFSHRTSFEGARFRGKAEFQGARFGRPEEELAPEPPPSREPPRPRMLSTRRRVSPFSNFNRAIFEDSADFRGATLAAEMLFERTEFRDDALFDGAEVSQRLVFQDASISSDLVLGVRIAEKGAILIANVRKDGSPAPERENQIEGARIHVGPMSLEHVELRSLGSNQTNELRFKGATDLEKLKLTDVDWPPRYDPTVGDPRRRRLFRNHLSLFGSLGYRVADERDLDRLGAHVLTARKEESGALGTDAVGTQPSAHEVERIYRNLRMNYEDRHDRVESHHWYVAEMEVGRRHDKRRFVRVSRAFYWFTSGYGLSPLRPLGWLIAATVLATALYLLPIARFCPVVEVAGDTVCGGWSTAVRVVLAALSFQSVPDGVSLSGLPGALLWTFVRFFGVAMLVSIGVAFRSQIAR
jgi:uncharacterized protein YjbI with pentapeptide repeats